MRYKYTLVIMFRSGNIWEVGVHIRDLAEKFGRMIVQESKNEVELLQVVNNKTGRITVLDHKKFLN